MDVLIKALMESKSFRKRQERLSEVIDYLSNCCSDLYFLFYREIKRREFFSNNPEKISKLLNNSNLFVRLHEALILVKSNNILAKEEYLSILNRVLYETIENRTNIDATVRICRLIEKSANLKNSIQRVYELNKDKLSTGTNHLKPLNLSNYSFQVSQITPLKHLNIVCDQQEGQQQLIPIWPMLTISTNNCMLLPCNLRTDNISSYLKSDCGGYDNLKMFESMNSFLTFDISQPQTFLNLTIVDQGIDGAVSYWLHYLKLHKYQWFFNSLSYLEIESIHEDNIERLIARVNINIISKGAQKKICRSVKILRDRPQKLKDLLLSLDLEVTPNELCEYTIYMRDILHYPIPNNNCFVSSQLQQDLVCVMEKLFNQIMEKLNTINYILFQSLLRTSVNTFLECTLLIIGNVEFTKTLLKRIVGLSENLKLYIQLHFINPSNV